MYDIYLILCKFYEYFKIVEIFKMSYIIILTKN